MFGATASGHKVKPLIIGTGANPRAFKGIDKKTLPVHYRFSSNAWMTEDIFREWYLDDFLHELWALHLGPLRIQFLLDNCSAHPKDLGDLDPKSLSNFYNQIPLH